MEKISHDTNLYSLGKGILKFDRFDPNGLPTGLVDLGNATEFNLSVSIETLKHYSSREGTRKVDKEITMLQELNGSFVLDEKSRNNMRLYFQAKTGTWAIKPLTVSEVRGRLDFISTNEVGPRWHVQLWDVKIKPAGEHGFIQEAEWGTMGFDFTVQSDELNHPDSPYGEIILIGES